MRIAVFGSGAVGGYFGGRLAQAGEEVRFIARGTHLAALQQAGLRVQSIDGDFVVAPVTATAVPAEIGPVDVVLVGVKTWQVADAARAMRPLIGPATMVVPLQNGVEAPAVLAAELGAQHVLGGLSGILSHIAEPGVIHHVGARPFIEFGELDNRRSKRAERLLDAFRHTVNIRAEIPQDIHVAMWRKFLLVSAWGAVGSVTRTPLGIFRSQPETRPLLVESMREILQVAHARGVALPEDSVETTLAFLDTLPFDSTSSMQRDIIAGRPSELEAQVGAVVRLGRAAGVATPVNTLLHRCLAPLERRARGELAFDV